MIVVTGGAGFIGSAIIWGLNKRGINDIIAVDSPGKSLKWKNFEALKYADYFDKGDFISKLEKKYFGNKIETIFHLGACSSTTETNKDYLIENNYNYTVRIASWQAGSNKARLIYASSAATYGAGENGYKDDEEILESYTPLNLYGYYKHQFDLLAKKEGWLSNIVGVKYFNVFGPNEYHKDDMRSVVNKAYPDVAEKGRMSLFRSYRKDYENGEQQRDFIYIKDAVEMTLFFFDHDRVNGIFNVGCGRALSWNRLAAALFAAAKKPLNIKYIPMPENIREKYQYYTCADMAKLKAAGCTHECADIENAVEDYVRGYLEKGRHLS